jgi:uncharacterized RDD family membrane protein YckC
MSVEVTRPELGPHPELDDDEYELSGWWRRVGAVFIDGLVLAIPLLILAAVTHAYTTTKDPYTGVTTYHTSPGFGLIDIVLWAIYLLLLVPREGAHNGQTLGKQALGIAIMRNDGYPIDLTTTSIREILCKGAPSLVASLLIIGGVRIAGLLLLVPLVDYLWPLWDSENRALHDHVAQTHVVRRARRRYFRPNRPNRP